MNTSTPLYDTGEKKTAEYRGDESRACWFREGTKEERSGYSTEEWEAMRARDLIATTEAIENRQKQWHNTNLWNATLYSNRQLVGFQWGSDPTDQEMFPANLFTENLVQAIGDALVAKACTTPIRPVLIPRGSSFKTRRLIRRVNRWLHGTWKQLGMDALCIRAFLDAYISNVGVIMPDYDGEGLVAESVFFDDLVVDNTESAHRAPPREYRVRFMAPRVAVEHAYGVTLDDRETKRQYTNYRSHGVDWVPVVRAWHLPERDGTGGREVIACGGRLLKDSPWKKPWPGVMVFHWKQALSGFFQDTGVEMIIPYQIKQNDLNEVIEDVQDLCRPKLLAHAGSQFDAQALDNVAAKVIFYTGVVPTPLNWPTALNDLYMERQRNREMCFRAAAVPEYMETGEISTDRLDSSQAVREAVAVGDSRHMGLWRAFDEFRLNVAKRLLEIMSDDSDAPKDHKTVWYVGGKAHAETIEWEQVKTLTEDMYTWSMEAVSDSSFSPAAIRDTLMTSVTAGFTPQDYMKGTLTAWPDMESIDRCQKAGEEAVDWMVEEMEDEVYHAPEPTTDLVYGQTRVTENINTLMTLEDVPPIVMTYHRRWLRMALALTKPEPAPQPGAPPMPPGPMGVGGGPMMAPAMPPMGMPMPMDGGMMNPGAGAPPPPPGMAPPPMV